MVQGREYDREGGLVDAIVQVSSMLINLLGHHTYTLQKYTQKRTRLSMSLCSPTESFPRVSYRLTPTLP